jgi:hypothetical protein
MEAADLSEEQFSEIAPILTCDARDKRDFAPNGACASSSRHAFHVYSAMQHGFSNRC